LTASSTSEITRVDSWGSAATLESRRHGGGAFPIVEPDRCTFAYHGPVESVRLVHFGVGLPADLAFEPLGDTEWWVLGLAVPCGARIEYKLEVTDSWGQRLIEDPLNTCVATNPFGANSVCEAWGYEVPSWAQGHSGVGTGQFQDVHLWSSQLGREVVTTLYLPDRRPAERARLVIVHDGGDYLRYAAAATVLDNLWAQRAVPPTIVAFLHPGERLIEYADDRRHAAFLASELVPHLERQLPLAATPAARCLVGSSFGAIAALSAAWRTPGFFGRLLLQSGSFAGAGVGCRRRPEPLWQPIRRFVEAYLAEPRRVVERAFVTCGAFESLICENRAMAPVLAGSGIDLRFVESPDGHNWACWRDTLGIGLPWLLQ
jgi:enterochelin esterase-like enzyme